MTDLPAAIDALTAAIRHDPTFASPYVLLARARILKAEQDEAGKQTEGFAKTRASAMGLLNEALELDPDSGEAYVERGYLNLYVDVAAADADFRRGLELAPNLARGYEGLAAVLFQSVARRREALEMLEKARRLDPLELRLDVLKATYLEWGRWRLRRGGPHAATRARARPIVRAGPGAPRRYSLGRTDPARGIRGTPRAGGRTRSRQRDRLAAPDAQLYRGRRNRRARERRLPTSRTTRPSDRLNIHLYLNEWREAGEAAYALVAAGPTYFQIEAQVALAIRRHARVTGDYRRAIDALENWAAVSWEGDEPILEGQLDMGIGVAGLADMLMATGQHDRARILLKELLANADLQINRFGRGEVWLNTGRALAYALLDRPEDAMAMLKRQARARLPQQRVACLPRRRADL